MATHKIELFILYCISGWSLFQASSCTFQRIMIFYPEKLSSGFTYDTALGNFCEVTITTADSQKINGLLFKTDSSKGVILYFHGNAGCLKNWQYIWNDLKDLKHDLLIIDYRGYGKSTGKPSESGLYADALASYDYLIKKGFKENEIIVFGRSIGTGVAVDLVLKRHAKGLILESPFLTLKWLLKDLFPYLMPDLIVKYKFNNVEKAPEIQCPVLILHGESDEIVPAEHGTMLFQVIRSEKELVIIKGGGHNDLNTFAEYKAALKKFLESEP